MQERTGLIQVGAHKWRALGDSNWTLSRENSVVMALSPPTKGERTEIIRRLCHVEPKDESQYETFLKFYGSAACTARAREHFVTVDQPAFKSHADLLRAVERLRASPTEKKFKFQESVFPTVIHEEKERGVRTIARVGFLIDCAAKDDYSEGYRLGTYLPVKWEANETYAGFLGRAFPTSTSTSFYQFQAERRLKAWKLKKRYGITFLPTNDLVQHLLYDREARSIRIFHQVAFVKAQLRYTTAQGHDLGMGIEESVKAYVSIAADLLFRYTRSDGAIEAHYLHSCSLKHFARSTMFSFP